MEPLPKKILAKGCIAKKTPTTRLQYQIPTGFEHVYPNESK